MMTPAPVGELLTAAGHLGDLSVLLEAEGEVVQDIPAPGAGGHLQDEKLAGDILRDPQEIPSAMPSDLRRRR